MNHHVDCPEVEAISVDGKCDGCSTADGDGVLESARIRVAARRIDIALDMNRSAHLECIVDEIDGDFKLRCIARLRLNQGCANKRCFACIDVYSLGSRCGCTVEATAKSAKRCEQGVCG